MRLFLLLTLLACTPQPGDSGESPLDSGDSATDSSDSGVDTNETLPTVSSGSPVGAEGAVVTGQDGSSVEIPAGALSEEVVITVGTASTGFETPPGVSGSPVFALEPHGTVFAVPVTIRIPHTLNPGEAVMWTSQPGGPWEKLTSVDLGTETEVQVTHFSYFFNGREVCGLMRQECCVSPDDACAGDLLECVDLTGTGPGTCLPCGLEGEPCCDDTTCAAMSTTCADGWTGTGALMCVAGSVPTCRYACEAPGDTGR